MYQQTILALAIEMVGEGEAGIYTPGRAWQAEVAGRLADRQTWACIGRVQALEVETGAMSTSMSPHRRRSYDTSAVRDPGANLLGSWASHRPPGYPWLWNPPCSPKSKSWMWRQRE